MYPALSRIADFSDDTADTAARRARALLAGPWTQPPTAADQIHVQGKGRYMLAIVLDDR